MLNNKVNKIIEDPGFKVELSFTYEKDKKELIIIKVKKSENQLQFLDNMIFQNNKKKEWKFVEVLNLLQSIFLI